jgi:hypothetical protein
MITKEELIDWLESAINLVKEDSDKEESEFKRQYKYGFEDGLRIVLKKL